ncbi:MAG TPA: hypothetical protein VHZ78_03160 [Rhizomicrobium sp.]|jgi:hypothetical protein|nr:hypothetical protein [Rhizomicrobium sp.]
MSGNNPGIIVVQKIYILSTGALADVNVAIDQVEPAGPLVGMTNGDDQAGQKTTILSFDLSKPGPAKHAVVQLTSTAPPASATKVCQGMIYIAGTLTDCTAYRPN